MRATSVSCRRQLPLLLIGAIFTALTLVYPSVGLLEWLAMIPLLIGAYRLCEERECTLRRAYGYGFLTVYVFYFVIYHWFVNLYPLDFVGMDNASSAVVIAAGWFGLPLLQAIPRFLLGYLYSYRISVISSRGSSPRHRMLWPWPGGQKVTSPASTVVVISLLSLYSPLPLRT